MTNESRRTRPTPRSIPIGGLLLAVTLLASSSAIAGEPPACSIDFSTSPCLEKMIEKIRARGWVGIHLGADETGSWRIRAVLPESPAESAGLRANDRLLALDGVPYTKGRKADLEKIYDSMVPGHEIVYTVGREGGKTRVKVTLAPVPEHIVAQWIGKAVLESFAHQHAEPPRPPESPEPPRSPKASGNP